MKKVLFVICISFLMLSCSQHPALKVFSWYSDIEKENYVIPYMLNLIAVQKLEEPQNIKHIKKYLIWTFSKLNYPDKQGVTGSIYDFHISNKGREVSSENYDSVDSYSATFLILLNEYMLKTDDKEFLQNNKKEIFDIVYTMAFLQDKDGLTSAVPNSKTKYLMDNCEVFGGLQAFVELSENMGWENADYYKNISLAQRNGIFNFFYNYETRNFNWAVDDNGIHVSDWHTFYPDAIAQLFPIAYKLVDDQPLIRKHIWQKYSELYRNKKNIPLEQQLVIAMAEKRVKK